MRLGQANTATGSGVPPSDNTQPSGSGSAGGSGMVSFSRVQYGKEVV